MWISVERFANKPVGWSTVPIPQIRSSLSSGPLEVKRMYSRRMKQSSIHVASNVVVASAIPP